MAYNGSADLRSSTKEVYFRSWDFANSQMCEVRVATSNICWCNPPNRCGKRSGADFATSFSGLAKVAIFTTNVDAENQTLINHKTVCGALNRHFCQTRVIGSVFFFRPVCQSVVRLLCKLFDKALVIALARAALAMCLQNALAYWCRLIHLLKFLWLSQLFCCC